MAKRTIRVQKGENVWIHLFFILFCTVCFLIPFIYVISISMSSKESIIADGYRLWPKQVDFTAYKMVLADPTQIIDSYKVTIASTFLGTFTGVFLMALIAYPLSRSNFVFRKHITFYLYFTTLFGGGLIPTYILCTQYLHLGNSFWIYLVTGIISPWNIIIIRTFFQGIPTSLVEASKIDGASEMTIFFKIILPLSKPVIATISVMLMLARWNDWNTSLIYIQDSSLYTLQYLLQKILKNAEFVENMSKQGLIMTNTTIQEAPTESMKFAMVVIAAGPMFFVFPFFQKYFAQGLTVGAVKG